jgi:chromosome segregation ATPase
MSKRWKLSIVLVSLLALVLGTTGFALAQGEEEPPEAPDGARLELPEELQPLADQLREAVKALRDPVKEIRELTEEAADNAWEIGDLVHEIGRDNLGDLEEQLKELRKAGREGRKALREHRPDREEIREHRREVADAILDGDIDAAKALMEEQLAQLQQAPEALNQVKEALQAHIAAQDAMIGELQSRV